ncbi:MAG: class I SAM-dependent methyltransferase [Gammaproteobacteria bacterium]
MPFWHKPKPSYERAMDWFKQHMIADKGIIVHTRQPVPYPEVTGYYIPTLYDWQERALARICTKWLLSIQLPEGAFPAPDGVPYTFDTAQVMRGLCAALEDMDGVETPLRRACDWLVAQFLTLGVERWRDELVGLLVGLMDGVRGAYERSDVDVREKEGLAQRTGLLWGEEPPGEIEIVENGRPFLVDVRRGHKTGFYLDQRENRARLPAFCAGAEVLDAFSYVGGFSVYAAAGGAKSVTLVDESAPALELARRNLAINGCESAEAEFVEGNVFSVLRGYRAEERRFDVVVLDPPKFAHSGREVERAARAYKDVNLLAFQLLRPGGVLFTFSCSGAVSADLFQKIVFGAALDAGRDAQIVGHLAQGADHPVALTFPEGAYLKGLICRVW